MYDLDIPDHPTSAEVQQYLEDYAGAFGLTRYFRLGTSVIRVYKSEDQSQWTVITNANSRDLEEAFDKIVITTGSFYSPVIPRICGSENFLGKVIHSQAFKRWQFLIICWIPS